MAQEPHLDGIEPLLAERLGPGRDFLKALRALGLEPDALFWAKETKYDRMVLVLVTSFFDYAGPLEVSRALFKAYNAAATPAEIDPFLVRLHSPRQTIFRTIRNTLSQDSIKQADGRIVELGPKGRFEFAGLRIPVNGIIKRPSKPLPSIVQARKWRRFSDNVELLAA